MLHQGKFTVGVQDLLSLEIEGHSPHQSLHLIVQNMHVQSHLTVQIFLPLLQDVDGCHFDHLVRLDCSRAQHVSGVGEGCGSVGEVVF